MKSDRRTNRLDLGPWQRAGNGIRRPAREPLVAVYQPAGSNGATHRGRGLVRSRCFQLAAGIAPAPGRLPYGFGQASLPGASPEIMASSVATPLERQFGRIAAVTEMTSSSSLGQTSITLQFDLNRNIDAAARDVEAAINAARGYLPADLPGNPDLPQGESGRFAHHDHRAHFR